MIPRPPRSTRTDTLFPYTSLFRSDPSQLRIGQVLRLNSSGPAPSAVATPVPVTPVKPVEPTSTVRANDAALINWSWPATGKIIQGFNSRSEEHTSELQSLMRISYAVFCLKKKKETNKQNN